MQARNGYASATIELANLLLLALYCGADIVESIELYIDIDNRGICGFGVFFFVGGNIIQNECIKL